MPPVWVWPLGGIFAGTIAGSFLATLILRWPAGRSIAVGRSQCDICRETLAPVELIPLLSWLTLGGRCRRCSGMIDRRHAAIEAAAALIGGLSLAVAPGAAGACGALFGWLLLALAALDAEHYWLPDALTLPLLAAGIAAGAAGIAPVLTGRLIGAGAGYGALVLVGVTYQRMRGRSGLGGGDAKLFAAIGAWLGWQLLPAVLLTAALAGLAWVGVRWARRQPVSRHDRLPLGALLAAAAWMLWLASRR